MQSSIATWAYSQPAPSIETRLACHSMTGTGEAAEFLDIDMHQLARTAATRSVGPDPAESSSANAPKPSSPYRTDRGASQRQCERTCRLPPASPAAAVISAKAGRRQRVRMTPSAARRPILQSGRAVSSVACQPLIDRARRDAHGHRHRSHRPSLNQNTTNQHGSTLRRGAGILVNVHPAALAERPRRRCS